MNQVLRPQSLVDALREALTDAILRGQIEAGAQLTEQGVAEQYSIARPTAKAAIEQLVHIGLLRRNPNKTAHVPLLNAEDVRDLYFSRSLVEMGVVGELASLSIQAPAAMRAIDRMRQHESDLTEVVDADIEFHRALVESLGSIRAARLLSAVIGEVHLCMAQVQLHHLLSVHVIADEHLAILTAISEGKPEEAKALMHDHLYRARDQLIAHLSGQEIPFPENRQTAPVTSPAAS